MKKLSAILTGCMLLAGCNGSSNGPNGAAYQQAVTGYNPNKAVATGAGGTANPTGVKSGTKGSGGTSTPGSTPGSTGSTPGSTGTTPGSTPASGGASNWLYVADANGVITTFKVDPTAGTISGAADTALPSGFGPMGMAVDPTGTILFVTGVGGSTPAGQLIPVGLAAGTLTVGTPVNTANPLPFSCCVDPASEAVFTGDFNTAPAGSAAGTAPNPGTVSAFTYASGTGALTAGSPASAPLLSSPAAVCMDAGGNYVFACEAAGIVEIVGIKGGAISPAYVAGSQGLNVSVNGSTTSNHQSNAIVLSGTTLIVGNIDDTLSVFDLSSTAATPPQVDVTIHTPALANKAFVSGLAIDSTGAFLVSANGGTAGGNTTGGTDDCTLFTINGATVTPVASTVALATSNPAAVTFNGAGAFCYVANAGTNTVDAFSVSATAITPLAGSPFALPTGDQAPFGIAASK